MCGSRLSGNDLVRVFAELGVTRAEYCVFYEHNVETGDRFLCLCGASSLAAMDCGLHCCSRAPERI